MGNVIGGLLGIVGLGGAAKAPKVSSAAADSVTADANRAKTARAALYATDGGVSGQELSPSQVQKRPTLFGN